MATKANVKDQAKPNRPAVSVDPAADDETQLVEITASTVYNRKVVQRGQVLRVSIADAKRLFNSGRAKPAKQSKEKPAQQPEPSAQGDDSESEPNDGTTSNEPEKETGKPSDPPSPPAKQGKG